jgi:hypothetical protein
MKTCYALIIFCSFSSCLQEELAPENHDFRGSWDSRKYAIQIFSNGSGNCDIKYRGRCEGNVRIKGNKMIFTSENENDDVSYKKFHIDQRPVTDSLGVTYMVLDGHKLVRH